MTRRIYRYPLPLVGVANCRPKSCITFKRGITFHHAWVVMKCDPSLKSNARLWPTICNSNEGQWISVDATRHFVAPLSQTPCVSLSIFWNDKGIYPLTYGDAAVPDYANGTKRGLVYPSDVVCNTFGEPTINDCKNNFAVEHNYDDLCAPQKVECVLP